MQKLTANGEPTVKPQAIKRKGFSFGGGKKKKKKATVESHPTSGAVDLEKGVKATPKAAAAQPAIVKPPRAAAVQPDLKTERNNVHSKIYKRKYRECIEMNQSPLVAKEAARKAAATATGEWDKQHKAA